jgi:uncharacterized protein YbjQ (UPF0145 family)
MSNLEKLLQMLESPKPGKRYDACEELRVGKETSPQVVLALEKAMSDADPEVADAARRALDADAHRPTSIAMGRIPPKMHDELAREEATRAMAAIIMVTTPSIQGCPIRDYLGIISTEVVLATWPISDVAAGLANILGTRQMGHEQKLKEAKETALKELRLKAHELGANAILGVDLDYTTISNHLLMIVASGTAVRLEPQATAASDQP